MMNNWDIDLDIDGKQSTILLNGKQLNDIEEIHISQKIGEPPRITVTRRRENLDDINLTVETLGEAT